MNCEVPTYMDIVGANAQFNPTYFPGTILIFECQQPAI